MRVNIEYNY